MFTLEGSVAAVTGAARGLGAAIAIGLAEAGADVALLGPSAARLADTTREVTARGRRCSAVQLDVRDIAAIRPAFDLVEAEIGPIDILVNNAGVNQTEPSLEVLPETWDLLHQVNLRGPFFCAVAVARGMLARGRGKIINITSDAGVKGYAEHAAYGSSKGGLIQLTRNLAAEWGPRGVQVNAVAPGAAWTDMTRPAMEIPELARSILSRGVSTRITEPNEVAAAVTYLASREADQVTGQILFVDGGSHAS